jgi:outer membrane protein assembly factor BamB
MRSRFIMFTLCAVGLLLPPPSVSAADWPQWLGPNRDGVWSETNILDKFPSSGPKVLWRKPINPGYSGPTVANGRLIVMDRVRKEATADTPNDAVLSSERVLCLDPKTGEQLWVHEYPRQYQRVDRPMGPRTTAAIDGDRVYTLGTMGDLYCLDATSGKPIWNTYFPDAFSTKPPVWGYSSHLLIHDGLVIALVGGEGSAVVAFDKTTGAKKWSALTSADVGYSAPVLATAGGTKQLIVWLSDQLAGLNPKTGEVLWKHAHPETGKKQMTPAVSIITPKVVGNLVIVSSAYDGPLAVKLADDKPTAEIAWRSTESFPKQPEKMPVLMTTLIAKRDYLYGVTAPMGDVMCAKLATGETVWKNKQLFGGKDTIFGSAFWVEQGDRVFCFTDAGDLVILKLNPEQYEEVDRVHILDPIGADRGRKVIWSHPAFANQCMFVRNEKEIVCVSLAKS